MIIKNLNINSKNKLWSKIFDYLFNQIWILSFNHLSHFLFFIKITAGIVLTPNLLAKLVLFSISTAKNFISEYCFDKSAKSADTNQLKSLVYE